MKRRVGTVLAVGALVAAFGALPAAQGAGSASVEARNFEFSPKRLVISKKTTVTWTISGTHNVKGKGWGSGLPQSGGSYSHKFRKAGKYRYVCIPHSIQGMKGVVIVR